MVNVISGFNSFVNATVFSPNQLVNFFSKIAMYEFAKITLVKVKDLATPYFKEIIKKTLEPTTQPKPNDFSCPQCEMLHRFHKEKIEAIAKEKLTEKKISDDVPVT